MIFYKISLIRELSSQSWCCNFKFWLLEVDIVIKINRKVRKAGLFGDVEGHTAVKLVLCWLGFR